MKNRKFTEETASSLFESVFSKERNRTPETSPSIDPFVARFKAVDICVEYLHQLNSRPVITEGQRPEGWEYKPTIEYALRKLMDPTPGSVSDILNAPWPESDVFYDDVVCQKKARGRYLKDALPREVWVQVSKVIAASKKSGKEVRLDQTIFEQLPRFNTLLYHSGVIPWNQNAIDYHNRQTVPQAPTEVLDNAKAKAPRTRPIAYLINPPNTEQVLSSVDGTDRGIPIGEDEVDLFDNAYKDKEHKEGAFVERQNAINQLCGDGGKEKHFSVDETESSETHNQKEEESLVDVTESQDEQDQLKNKSFVLMQGWAMDLDLKLIKDGPTLEENIMKMAENGIDVHIMLFDNVHAEEDMNAQFKKEMDQLIAHGIPYVHITMIKPAADLKGEVYTNHEKIMVLVGKDGDCKSCVSGLDFLKNRQCSDKDPIIKRIDNEIQLSHPEIAWRLSCDFQRQWINRPIQDNQSPGQVESNYVSLCQNVQKSFCAMHKTDSLKAAFTSALLAVKNLEKSHNNNQATVKVLRTRHANNTSGLNVEVDSSIRDEYVRLIKGAEQSICIENQYFSTNLVEDGREDGTAPLWKRRKKYKLSDSGAGPIIQALIDKIKQRIDADEPDFFVEITLPKFPVPQSSRAGKRLNKLLLRKQYKTMNYVQDEIRKYIIKHKNEIKGDSAYINVDSILRFNELSNLDKQGSRIGEQVYVHSKWMVVDEGTDNASVIAGSFNMNNRSSETDTEVCISISANGDKAMSNKISSFRNGKRELWYGCSNIAEVNKTMNSDGHVGRAGYWGGSNNLLNSNRGTDRTRFATLCAKGVKFLTGAGNIVK